MCAKRRRHRIIEHDGFETFNRAAEIDGRPATCRNGHPLALDTPGRWDGTLVRIPCAECRAAGDPRPEVLLRRKPSYHSFGLHA